MYTVDWDAVTAICLVATPILLVWHLELAVTTTYIERTTLDNGFVTVNAARVYHALMYVVFAVTWVAAYRMVVR